MTSSINRLMAVFAAVVSLTSSAEAGPMGTTIGVLKGAQEGAPGLRSGVANAVLPSAGITPSAPGSCMVVAEALIAGIKTDGTPLDDAYLDLRILKDESGIRTRVGTGLLLWENAARAFTSTIHYVIPVKAGVFTKFGCEINNVYDETAGGTAYCYVSYICQ